MLLHVVRETDRGIVVRGAKFETAAAYANQAFVKPTIGDWGQDELSDYAVGFIARMDAPGIKHICRSGFAGSKPAEDYPLTNRFDEIDTLIVFDDVEIPWEDVLFYRHTRAASFIRATLHRYSQFAFVQRQLRYADLLVGAAYASVTQTGVKMHQGVREKLAELVCYREGINAHLTAAIEHAEPSPGGLLMPNQALMYTGRVLAGTQLSAAIHIARDLCGGQMCVTPSAASFEDPETGPWLEKYYRIGDVPAEDRRRLLAFARDLMDSDYAGHRLTFQLFAQSPPFSHLLAVYNNYDFEGPLDLVRKAADLSDDAVPARMAAPRMSHKRIRPFNTRDTYPEQQLDNDLCQAVVAGNLVFVRGQVGQDLETSESVGVGDVDGAGGARDGEHRAAARRGRRAAARTSAGSRST